MARPKNEEETASRANDQKGEGESAGNRGGRASDGKDEDTPQGGKRRGPGRWVDPHTSGD